MPKMPMTHVLMQREIGRMPANKETRHNLQLRSALRVAQMYAARVFTDLRRSATRLARLPGITARYILLLNKR